MTEGKTNDTCVPSVKIKKDEVKKNYSVTVKTLFPKCISANIYFVLLICTEHIMK